MATSEHVSPSRSSRPPPRLGVVETSRDPLTGVLALGRSHPMRVTLLALLAALLVHGTAAGRVALINVDLLAWSREMRAIINDKLAATYDIEVEKPKPPEPPPEEPKEEPKPVEKAPPPPKEVAPKDTPPPPPAAAQAGAVLTQKPDDAPVDFTNSFVTGSGDSFAGGVTQATGTSTKAVYNRAAQAGGVPGGTGTAPAPPPPGVDHSRGLSSVRDWTCPFPPEADSEQIDEMTVTVDATIGPDGHVTSARFVNDPGFGFGRAAVRCAFQQSPDTFSVALDRDGHPMSASRKFSVHFTR